MKITEIKTFRLKEWRTMLFVQVITDEGITGLGEAGLTTREGAVAGMIEDLSPLLIGADPFRIEHHWQTLWRGGFYPAGQVLSAAIAAIDIALHDIKAKALGVPVYELLGGRVRDKVATYCHFGGATSEETIEQAHARVADGWTCLRWEPSYGADLVMDGRAAVDRAIDEFASLRDELGYDIDLIFDAHTKLTPTEATYLCRQVETYRPLFIEDPLRSEYPQAYRQLRSATDVPLAAGEQFATKWMFRELIEDDLIDFARIDVCIAGGLTEARKIAAMCETHMIDIAVHNPIGPISTAACLHLNLCCSNVLVQELPRRPGECVGDLISTDQEWRDGFLFCAGSPGLGLELHPDKLDNHAYEPAPLPILRRPDGSFTNW